MGEQTVTIGFVGQGWIGKNYSDDLERRGFTVVRYALEEPYQQNKEKIAECPIVFVAVPTPTTPDGFDYSIVKSAIALAAPGSIVVVKSSIVPGTTELLQDAYPDRIVMHSPEFLREAHAAEDAAHPVRNILGLSTDSPDHRSAAEMVLSVLPEAPYARIMPARAAELVKYAGNNFLYIKVVFANLLYELATVLGTDYEAVKEALGADPRIGPSHLTAVHPSRPGEVPARGAAGHCFIKDFAAFCDLYEKLVPEDTKSQAMLRAIEAKNVELLRASQKDRDLLDGVYGAQV